MAEQEEAQAQAIENDEVDETPGYKPPAPKSLDEIKNQDQDDESLVKYKQALLGGCGAGEVVIPFPKDPRKVIVNKMALVVEGRPNIELDLTKSTEDIKSTRIVLKEGTEYQVEVYFYIQREIVTGLKYHHVVSRKGIKVDKSTCMVGSYGPSTDLKSYKMEKDEAPKGMIARGDYKVISKFLDDDKKVHLEWEWHLTIKKDWE